MLKKSLNALLNAHKILTLKTKIKQLNLIAKSIFISTFLCLNKTK